MVWFRSLWSNLRLSHKHCAGAILLLPLILLQDMWPGGAQAEYDHAQQLFLHGYLENSQQEAKDGYNRFRISNPPWASKFLLLEAKAMVWRGMYESALRILSAQSVLIADANGKVEKLTLEAAVFAHLQQFTAAHQTLMQAEDLCAGAGDAACDGVLRARGMLTAENGQFAEARKFFLRNLSYARLHCDKWSETNALLNLGFISLQDNHYDEASVWSKAAYRTALDLDNENLAQIALGNLGWAYFELGDAERALEMFFDAERQAEKLGNLGFTSKWLANIGYIYRSTGDLEHAAQSYRQALGLAKQIESKQDIINSLEDLTYISIETGKLDEATAYIDQATPMIHTSGNRLDELDIILAQGEIAAARRQDQQAQSSFLAVQRDPASQTSMRLDAGHELAKLYEQQGNTKAADRMYKTTLTTFESARAQLKNEDSKLPFLSNATHIYDDYIHFLVKHGRIDEALQAADQSRAQTLAQGLGLGAANQSFKPAALHPTEIAKKTGATLLFYWLGEKQSYLWAITPAKTALFLLPAQSEIAPVVERYRKALLGPTDVLKSSNEDGLKLYQLLIAPAKDMIPPGSSAVILSDGVLSQLNLETLLVPAPLPHYWIEDVTLTSAPSLYLLASAKPFHGTGNRLLLLGDALSPNSDYPELPMAAIEMQQIEKHFAEANRTVFARQMANYGAYIASAPQQYTYIHFVTHGIASRTDPLDSAIILSRATTAEDSFKLYAREIIQHPLHARLVTISACYGSGTRSYAGEGLVGLSWAFLRAGAHNVIGALWEVSDDSTPRLMDALYQGLEDGMPPNVALRQAKLNILHSQGKFSRPFFWAPFQIYTGI